MAACTTENASCPSCGTPVDLDAAVTCEPRAIVCGDAGTSTVAEVCRYDAPTESSVGFARALGHAIGCRADDPQCSVALADLRFEACLDAVDPCRAMPCRNGGTCFASDDGFTCSCPAGFIGALCESQLDECANDPCAPGQVCFDTVGSYLCRCPDGYTGANCAVDVDECTSGNRCANGGTCVNDVGSFHCVCPYGFSGSTCEIDRRFCTGTALACSTHTSGCTSAPGCTLGRCSGTPTPCTSFYSSSSCGAAGGCYWLSGSSRCSGYRYACEGYATSTNCIYQSGCSWLPNACTGSPTPCSSLAPAQCSTKSGCQIGVLP